MRKREKESLRAPFTVEEMDDIGTAPVTLRATCSNIKSGVRKISAVQSTKFNVQSLDKSVRDALCQICHHTSPNAVYSIICQLYKYRTLLPFQTLSGSASCSSTNNGAGETCSSWFFFFFLRDWASMPNRAAVVLEEDSIHIKL